MPIREKQKQAASTGHEIRFALNNNEQIRVIQRHKNIVT